MKCIYIWGLWRKHILNWKWYHNRRTNDFIEQSSQCHCRSHRRNRYTITIIIKKWIFKLKKNQNWWRRNKDLIRLSLENYADIRRTHSQDIRDKLEILSNITVLKSYSSDELIPLCDALLLKHYIPNKGTLFYILIIIVYEILNTWTSVIVEQDSEPTGMYFIKSGKCKMVKEMDVRPMSSSKKSAVCYLFLFFSLLLCLIKNY